jgi:hypothetical protein
VHTVRDPFDAVSDADAIPDIHHFTKGMAGTVH